jgi:hypothetical protein
MVADRAEFVNRAGGARLAAPAWRFKEDDGSPHRPALGALAHASRTSFTRPGCLRRSRPLPRPASPWRLRCGRRRCVDPWNGLAERRASGPMPTRYFERAARLAAASLKTTETSAADEQCQMALAKAANTGFLKCKDEACSGNLMLSARAA